jgi:hypothetical protein
LARLIEERYAVKAEMPQEREVIEF